MIHGGYSFYQRNNSLYPVSASVVDAAIQDAVARHPIESCGAVYDNEYFPVTNAHETPKDAWRFDGAEFEVLFLKYGRQPDAVIHSHPQGQPSPSKADMDYQMLSNVTCGLVVLSNKTLQDVVFWGDNVLMAPAVGRPFIHGVYDCYATLRDYYRREKGITLIDFSRETDWWLREKEPDMFVENFAKAGFVSINFSELEPGDVILGRIRTSLRVNHCGVYVGRGLLLHHLYGSPQKPRMSLSEPIYSWRKYVTHSLRYRAPVQVPAP